jgi:crotonobetainyl-CoA:carnitine CoA-transferase CaiB-like acyl-CoA transferase
VFQTKDDPVFIGVVTDALWEKFCMLFSLDELWADESLRESNERVKKRDLIKPQIRELVSGYTRSEIIEKLDGTGLPFAPIGKPEELFDDPHLAASGGLEEVRLDTGEETRLPALPLTMYGTRPARRAELSAAGAETSQILADLGYDADEVERILSSGAAATAD